MISSVEKRAWKRVILDDDESPPSKKRDSPKTKEIVPAGSPTADREVGEMEDEEPEGDSAVDAGSVATPIVTDHDSILDTQECARPVTIDSNVRFLSSLSSLSILFLR